MDRFDALQLFTRIVELGSFTRAAGALDIPRATATHAIKMLEERLGARLLERTTRQVRPTPDGQVFYERCKRILGDLDDAESALSTAMANPRGSLRLDLHGAHANLIILPRIQEFHRRYPQIELVISSGDRLVDLVGEGIDCVVRAGQPRDSSLVARRLALMPEVVCASPDYLDRHGRPRHPEELAAHQAVGFFSSNHDIRYPFSFLIDGEMTKFEVGGWISVNDAECYSTCALSGCGLIQVPRFRVEEHLRSGRLEEVLTEWPSPGLPVSALYPYHRQLSPRVRVFVEWLSALYAERFG
ncbi:transcriptional regulator, LysR family [Azotobacter vinelandii CA]|uniref:Transcriptional regulator, LysR family n=2 Tax=Azotobacter vinelandii TaxID=354 RepID=C1DKP3_AZOVD|nr:LysR family transcriptional regulator [Azotobacter vinelandii]ACO76906.1 transcriptional regulator, LysR family [Azotobacter vinelandii DJ]AGK17233.1 transcriptional regulator, LysR family [Azotobacter vinelandii CA]AGK19430.1 transcriptional regulator, LysR family [Azotobacter vinelandii CA6]WKN22655.1 LysR family transcriptional regulator [Azotobacter vinelandii]SFX41233.1 DNA-binding transcriptional regulator, LysR family [Azotobacter vinelandii]